MAAAGWRSWVRVHIVHGDVHAEVVATLAGFEECASNRVLTMERRYGPPAKARCVPVSEPCGKRTKWQVLRAAP